MDDTVDIKGLDPTAVLAALYNHARPLGMGNLQYDPTPMTTEEARAIFTEYRKMGAAKFDYLKGRVMKITLKEFDEGVLKSWLYDRDNGLGAAAMVVSDLRASTEPVRT